MSTNEPRIENLLLQDAFVRSLARSLIVDAHAAEDVAQETWVAALEGGGGAASLPRWLTGVVKNLVGKRVRGDHRRERREQGSARAEATPSGAEILEREAVRARVVAAVLALDEPYREGVLLRYFEGLPPRAIARRLGLPVETVRTRLKRALEMLRARLDREYGERGAWGAALLPFARAPLSSASLSVVGAASLGIAFVGLALVALYFGLHAREPVASAPTAVLASAGAAPVSAKEPVNEQREPRESAAPAARSSVDAEPPPAPALSIALGALHVHATWFDGTPAAGIRARIECWELESPSFRALEALTDENGTFALAEVPCGSASVTLDRECAGEVEIEAGSTATLEIRIPRGFDVDGQVVDREGAPVAGAELWLSDMPAFSFLAGHSLADGSFHLRSFSPYTTIGARAVDHAPSLLAQLTGEGGASVSVRLMLLGPGGALAGRVLAPGGEPVVGATVLVGTENNEFRRVFVPGEGELTGIVAAPLVVRTDADGRFLASGLATGRTFLAARADGFAEWRGEAEVRERERTTLDVSLGAEARLSGHVRDAHGDPIAGVRVQLEGHYGRIDPFCQSRADGSFHLEGLAPGRIQITAESSTDGKASTILDAQAGAELTWEAVLSLGLELRGRVLDDAGAPLADWHVSVRDELRLSPPEYGNATTDAEGRFTIPGLTARPHHLELQAPGDAGTFASTVLGGIGPEQGEQLFRVATADVPSVRVRGLVVDELGNVPTRLELELAQIDLGTSQFWSADAQGRFELGPFAPGPYVLRVRAQGHPEHVLGPRELAPGETWECGTIELSAAGALLVRVQRAPGTESLAPWFHVLQGSFDRGKVEPAGEVWRFDALAPGSFRLKMAGTGVAAALVPFEIRVGETTELELSLRAGSQREIRARVHAEIGARRPLLRITSAAGEVVLEDEMRARVPREFQYHPALAPGRYRVEVELANGTRTETELEVASEAPETQPLVLDLP